MRKEANVAEAVHVESHATKSGSQVERIHARGLKKYVAYSTALLRSKGEGKSDWGDFKDLFYFYADKQDTGKLWLYCNCKASDKVFTKAKAALIPILGEPEGRSFVLGEFTSQSELKELFDKYVPLIESALKAI